jgi:homoserine acetyltransferase
MKKIFITASMALLTGITTFAAPTPGDKITRKAHQEERRELRLQRKAGSMTAPTYLTSIQFGMDFPDAKNVSWTRDQFEKASFINAEGKQIDAFYDYNSQLIGTTAFVDYAQLPAAAHKQIDKTFKGYTVGPVLLYDDNEDNQTDMVLFTTPFEDRDNYFAELTKGDKKIVVQITMAGDVYFFKSL